VYNIEFSNSKIDGNYFMFEANNHAAKLFCESHCGIYDVLLIFEGTLQTLYWAGYFSLPCGNSISVLWRQSFGAF